MQEVRADIEIYERLIEAIQSYFCGRNIQYMFLHGGCYWLARVLQKYIPDSVIVFNRKMQHCACLFNNGIYDIRGRISSRGFFIATTKDIKYMQKHFVPSFDAEALENYLNTIMNNAKRKEDVICGEMNVT